MILNNNIENYIIDLCKQAEKLMPEDISVASQKEIVSTIYNFLKVAYEALSKEDNISHEDALLIMQFIGEWIFHKSIDMKRAGIEKKYIEEIQQKIAYTIYEIAKMAIGKNFSQEEMVKIIEHHVKNAYNEALDQAFNEGYIDKDVLDNALSQSNIDTMFEENENEEEKENLAQKINKSDKNKDLCVTINLSKIIRIFLKILSFILIILGIEFLVYMLVSFVK